MFPFLFSLFVYSPNGLFLCNLGTSTSRRPNTPVFSWPQWAGICMIRGPFLVWLTSRSSLDRACVIYWHALVALRSPGGEISPRHCMMSVVLLERVGNWLKRKTSHGLSQQCCQRACWCFSRKIPTGKKFTLIRPPGVRGSWVPLQMTGTLFTCGARGVLP